MCVRSLVHRLACAILVVGVTCLTPELARAHCDGLDGPVVKAAQRALETRDPAFTHLGARRTIPKSGWLLSRALRCVFRVRRLGNWLIGSSLKRSSACTVSAKARRTPVCNRPDAISAERFLPPIKRLKTATWNHSCGY